MHQPKGKGAWMAKVGEKGQIVIPKQARDMFGISPGDTLLILGDVDQGLAILSGDQMMEIAGQIFSGPANRKGEENDDRDQDGQADQTV